MNIWVKSLLIGLVSAGLTFFLYRETLLQNRKQLFTVHYILQIEPELPASGSMHEITADNLAKMARIIEKRCDAAGYQSTSRVFDHDEKLDIVIEHVQDTDRLRQLIMNAGKLEIRELYNLNEIAGKMLDDKKEPESDPVAISPVEKINDSGKAIKISELQNPPKPVPSAFDSIFTFSQTFTGSEIGLAEEKDTAALNKILQNSGSFPADLRFCYGLAGGSKKDGAKLLTLYAIRTNGEEKALIDNSDIKSASQDYGQSGLPQVTFSFTSLGARKWEMMTTKNRGRCLAIILDNLVITAPNVNEPITGGSSIISGGFTVEEAQILAHQLNAGMVPATLALIKKEISAERDEGYRKLLLIVLVMFATATGLSYFIFKALKNS